MTEPSLDRLDRLRSVHAQMKSELQRTIVGQDQVIDELLLAILTRGHCLLVGVPGLAKTLLISSLAKTLDLSFARIQFTPDLMPSDITGTELLQIDPVTNARTSSIATCLRPAIAACAFAPSTRNWLARGPAPHVTHSRRNESCESLRTRVPRVSAST